MASEARVGTGIPSDGVLVTIVARAIVPIAAGGPPARALPAEVKQTGVADQGFGTGLPVNVNK